MGKEKKRKRCETFGKKSKVATNENKKQARKHDKPVKKVGIPENKSLPSYTQVPYPPSPLRPMKTRIFSSAVIRIAKEKKE